MRGSSSDFNHETIPLTLTLSPRFNVNVLRDSFAGERGQITVHTNASIHPEQNVSRRIRTTCVSTGRLTPVARQFWGLAV